MRSIDLVKLEASGFGLFLCGIAAAGLEGGWKWLAYLATALLIGALKATGETIALTGRCRCRELWRRAGATVAGEIPRHEDCPEHGVRS